MRPAGVAVPVLAAEHDHSWNHCGEVGEISMEYVQAVEQQPHKEGAAVECASPSEHAVVRDQETEAHAVPVEAGRADAVDGEGNFSVMPRGATAEGDADVYI
jgi:hypothetical protein